MLQQGGRRGIPGIVRSESARAKPAPDRARRLTAPAVSVLRERVLASMSEATTDQS
jgi:hypothetical protein